MNTKNNYSLDSLANGENLTILSYNKENQTLLAQRHLNNQIIEFPFKDTFYLVQHRFQQGHRPSLELIF